MTRIIHAIFNSVKGICSSMFELPYVHAQARELLDMAVAAIMHANRVGQLNRCMSEARGLAALLRSAPAPGASAAALEAAAAAVALKSQALAENLLARRHYVDEDAAAASSAPAGGLGLYYDPRFLLFEFVHNIVLREAQVDLIREFVRAVRGGQPLVKQMLMGGGKTTAFELLNRQ